MVSVCARIGTLLALALGGVALTGGCGALPADWGDPASWTAAGIWSGQATGDVGDDGSSTAGADTADTDGEFLTVVSGTEQIRVLVQAGDDQVVNAGAHVVLDGSATRSGAPMELQYYWSQLDGPAVTLDAPESLRPNFRAPAATADLTLIFELRVSLGTQCARDTVAITVLGSGEPDSPPGDGVSPGEEPPPPGDSYPPPPAFEPPVAYAADWGFDPEDSTEYIQAAINSGARTVVIQNMGADWVVEPITLVSNQLIVFEPGVVVVAKPGSFHQLYDCLFTGSAVSNVTVHGYGATLRMRKEDYAGPNYAFSQWRSCLAFSGPVNLAIRGLRCEKSGGDGIWIRYRYDAYGRRFPAENVEITDCVCDQNYRQGISITGIRTLRINNCVLSNSSGSPPQSGLDIETDFEDGELSDIVVSNCVAQNNAGYGFFVQTKSMTTAAPPFSVLLQDCYATGNLSGGLGAMTTAAGPAGLVEFRNCVIDGGGAPGINARWGGALSQVRFTECIVQNIGGAVPLTGVPVNVAMPRVSELSPDGRVQFIDCTVYDTGNRHFMGLGPEAEEGIYDIRGTIDVYNSLDYPGRWYDVEEYPGLSVTYHAYP